MTKTVSIAPVSKTLTVHATQAHAFETFTAGIDRWWPRSHGVGSTPMVRSAIEPRPGGRWYTVHEDGSEVVVGHVRVWEPPSRVVFSWEISAQWKPDASVASEVEVAFTAEGPRTTRVDLVHRDFEALGPDGGDKLRRDVAGGWPGLLDLFRTVAER
ncbi:MAG TPA: SRPBCC family protein [Rhizomicrobium sp.]